MKLLSAEFVTSAAAGGDGIPRDGLPQIALAGRSNVGKSSLINALGRAKIARTSAAPGKTRLANIYRASLEGGPGGPGRWSVYLVDLPGYGYARGGADSAAELRAVAETYFAGRDPGPGIRRPDDVRRQSADVGSPGHGGVGPGTRAALLVVDARHPGLEADLSAAAWLDGLGTERRIVATKVDKLSRAERARNLRTLEDTFGTAALPVSAVSGEGLDALWQMIAKLARKAER